MLGLSGRTGHVTYTPATTMLIKVKTLTGKGACECGACSDESSVAHV